MATLYDQDTIRPWSRRRPSLGADVEEFGRLLALLTVRRDRITRLRQSSAACEMEFQLAQATRLLYQALAVLDDGPWFDDGA